ncbi:MAG: peptidoglycan-associated lipoprotein Pal [Magnetococcales bacterium]|nr:peptidoglycan-associated lipoprotein Pal [Magnetococcales bacterium]
MNRFKLLYVGVLAVGMLSGCGAKSGPNADGSTDGSQVADGSGQGIGRMGAGESSLGADGRRRGAGSGGAGYGDGSGGLSGQEPVHRVFFGFNADNVSDEAARILTDNARWIQQKKPSEIIVEGHCDERGTREFNLALGQKRAEAVKQFLSTQGVDWSRIRTVSFGKERPLVSGHDDFAWSQNRRAELVLR